MEAVQTSTEPLSFESIMAAFREVAEHQKESDKRLERMFREGDERLEKMFRETDERQKENYERQKENYEHQKENYERQQEEYERQEKGYDRLEKMFDGIAKRQKETDRQLSKFGNRYGEVIVHLVKPKIRKKLRKMGLHFDKIYEPYYADEKDRIITEVDILLENEEKMMLVEIKSKPSIDDIKEHVDRLERFRVWADKKGDKRKFLGAIAGMVFKENEKNYAMKNGFYIIKPSGDTFTINAPEGEYSPREW